MYFEINFYIKIPFLNSQCVIFLMQVTGANKGIGFGIMKELCAKFDGIVYLTARDEGRGLAAVKN